MTDNKKFIIGSRGSKLSLAYSGHVKDLLLKSNPQFDDNSIEIKIIKTTGDIFKNKKISEIGGKGVFSKQIEDELLDLKIDLAVHSLKDLPSKMTNGLCVNAVVKRNDPRDAFLSNVSTSFFKLKSQSKVGTSSLRRKAQLNSLRDDINIVSMRGNIDTRISKLKNKEFDAIVLSIAGLKMLKLENEAKEIFSVNQMLPAIGQGAIALQCRKNDQKTLDIAKMINDEESYCCIQAERALLEAIGGDCDTAVGGLAKLLNEKIVLKSELFSNDGNQKFVAESDEQKKAVFNDGKALGEHLIESYPESAPARYWYLVNLGSWAEVYGILSAAKEGVADLMRDHSNKIIQLDPEYSNGGGYFMLGAVHFKSPYIPFILSWPRNDKAIEYLTKAFESGRPTPSQTVYLARAVYKDGQKDRAKNLLTALLEQPFSENEPVEDFEQHHEAKTLLEDWK